MPMKNPPHPGHLVKDEIEFFGLSIAEAARGLGITRQQLYRIVRGESGISSDVALRLEQAIGSTAELWLGLQAAYDLAQARLKGAPVVKKLETKSVDKAA
jgi:addiction module HigA family antidote